MPWQRWYPPGTAWDAPIPVGTLPGLLDDAVVSWGDRPTLRFRGARISFRTLRTMADRLARGLLASGLGAGDSVALYLPNTAWHPVAFFAVLRTGARVVHLSPLDAPRMLAYKLADSAARTLITVNQPSLLEVALDLRTTGKVSRLLVGDDAMWGEASDLAPLPLASCATDLSALMHDGEAAWPRLQPHDLALLQYTGGPPDCRARPC